MSDSDQQRRKNPIVEDVLVNAEGVEGTLLRVRELCTFRQELIQQLVESSNDVSGALAILGAELAKRKQEATSIETVRPLVTHVAGTAKVLRACNNTVSRRVIGELKRVTEKLCDYARRLEFLGWEDFKPTVELLDGRECKLVHHGGSFGKLRISELPHLIGNSTLGLLNSDESYQRHLRQVSAQHALLSVEKGILIIRDCNSLNGTFVNGSRVSNDIARQLNDGDQVTFGTLQFTLSLQPPTTS